MKTRKSPTPESPPPTAVDDAYGLFLWGVVNRRWKKSLENGTVVLSYDVSGIVVTQYNPTGTPYAIGEVVRLQVEVRAYSTKNGPRYSLTLPGAYEGEF